MSDATSIPSEDVLTLDRTLVQGTLVACATVLLYDHLCTLDQEIAYVWSNPWSISSILFFLNRYGPFVDTFLSLYLKFSYLSPEKCHVGYSIVTWCIVLGTLISETILLLRTYAIWERRRPILITLCILALIVFVPAMVVTDIEYKSLVYATVHNSAIPGCQLVHASPLIFAAYVLLVFSETIMVILTSIKAYRHLQHSRSGWVFQMYQDGILFYFYVLSISLANILVPLLAAPVFANWLASPQRILHSILCSRVLFLIFKQRAATTMTNRITPRQGQLRPGPHPHPNTPNPSSRYGSGLPLHPGYDGQYQRRDDSVVFTEMAETDTSITLNILNPTIGIDAYGGYTERSSMDEEEGGYEFAPDSKYSQLASGSTGGSGNGEKPPPGKGKYLDCEYPPLPGPSRAGPPSHGHSSSHHHHHSRTHSRTPSSSLAHTDTYSHLSSSLFPAYSHFSHSPVLHEEPSSSSRGLDGVKSPSSSNALTTV